MNLNLTTATRYGLNVLAALALSVSLYLGRSIFIPLTIAGLLAAILWPAADGLYRRFRMSWFFACAAVISGLVVAVLLVTAVVALSVPRILQQLPKPNDDASMKKFYGDIRNKFVNMPFDVEAALPSNPDQSGVYLELKKFLQGEQITNLLLSLGGQGVSILTESVLVLFILLFLLVEGQMLADKIRNIFGPAPDAQAQVSAAFRGMAEGVRDYLVWRTIVNIGLGIVLGLVYKLCGLENWLLWALLTVILCYIPYLGTVAAGVPPILDALLNVENPLVALGILVFYVTVVTVEGYIIVPWVMGRSMDLNATTVLISCLFWFLLWGTAGLFLAMPLMAAIRAVCLQVPGWAPIGHLMGSEETPPADDVVRLAVIPPAGTNGEPRSKSGTAVPPAG